MSEPIVREGRFYLNDMIGFAEKVLSYTDGFDQQGFIDSGLNYDATVRKLELIGEAAISPILSGKIIRKYPGA